uniref:Uncharacterized protein n=1 Tax=Rhizophagus irregularis (strain DAOM 181602 / DAOM 197198 / MUCL 43194) TaxID=747089 RepID=U9TW35_RHIID
MKVNFKLYKSQNINGFLNEVLFCCIGYFGQMEDQKAAEISVSIKLFIGCYKRDEAGFEDYIVVKKEQRHYEIEKRFKEAEEYRKSHLTSYDENKRLVAHPQAIYASRLLNPFTKNISKYDNVDNNTVEIIDFTKMIRQNE